MKSQIEKRIQAFVKERVTQLCNEITSSRSIKKYDAIVRSIRRQKKKLTIAEIQRTHHIGYNLAACLRDIATSRGR